jgi:hypothetical protein
MRKKRWNEALQPWSGRSRIAEALSLSSIAYAGEIWNGRIVPHPRHWLKLAELVGAKQELTAAARVTRISRKRAWDPTMHPAWLNEDVYRTKVQPGLRGITVSKIVSTLGISWA